MLYRVNSKGVEEYASSILDGFLCPRTCPGRLFSFHALDSKAAFLTPRTSTWSFSRRKTARQTHHTKTVQLYRITLLSNGSADL
jgi:hypothetical protein